ncbi:hypothetical protein BN10_320001 [Phycicoccus elongatus Lp2]|uniref:Uncharacterized protein n=1 Tax=Phycicoccus elongatus Lp2 TaxID=1193181 RepID=N0E1Y7_9MICO|nr:site-specific integrase [Phycicoccus elongatus]CCH69776.1 hypothetical protein BN10_320001 [Phycicoccus elongatus Lp2]
MSAPTRIRSTLNTARLRRLTREEFVLKPGLSSPGAIAIAEAVAAVRDAVFGNTLGTNYQPLTQRKYHSDLGMLERFLTASGAVTVADITTGMCSAFLYSEPAGGRHLPAAVDGFAAYGTQTSRKTVLRLFFVFCAHLGLSWEDPSREVKTVGSSSRRWKPLDDEQVAALKRTATLKGRVGRAPALLAVLLAGATVAEAAFVEVRDVRLDERLIFLPGTGRATVPRWVPLDDWQATALGYRLERLRIRHSRDGEAYLSAPVVTDGQPQGKAVEASATGSQNAAKELLARSGLFARDGYTPRSIRAYVAASVYAETRSVNAVAVRLGMAYLPRAAALAGADWRAAWELAPSGPLDERYALPGHLTVERGGDDDGS